MRQGGIKSRAILVEGKSPSTIRVGRRVGKAANGPCHPSWTGARSCNYHEHVLVGLHLCKEAEA